MEIILINIIIRDVFDLFEAQYFTIAIDENQPTADKKHFLTDKKFFNSL